MNGGEIVWAMPPTSKLFVGKAIKCVQGPAFADLKDQLWLCSNCGRPLFKKIGHQSAIVCSSVKSAYETGGFNEQPV